MTKQQIEIDIPEGLEFVRFGKATKGESWLNGDATMDTWRGEEPSVLNVVIVRLTERWRVPTKLDLLNRDSIECRVRDGLNHDWLLRTLIAVSDSPDCHEKRFYVFEGRWKYCEIRDTEPKPKECWKVSSKHGDHTFCESTEHVAKLSCSQPGSKVRRFVEVPE